MTVTRPAGPGISHGRRRAMGSDAHVVVVDDDNAAELLGAAWQRVDELERRWSRFLPDSEVTALNRNAGMPLVVSTDTVVLIDRAVDAWQLTGGRYDPTVGAALIAHGYDRDFDEVAAGVAAGPGAASPAPGLAGVEVDPDLHLVTLPPGVTFDPGGIGKGLAADLVVDALLAAGAAGALVNLGGDLRAEGVAPGPAGWSVSVPDPQRPELELTRLAVARGAVATTSRLRRRWHTPAGMAHHLIDPATGRPADSAVVAVTVVAGEAWWAEALSKALFLAGPDGLHDLPGAHAVVVTADGRRHASADLEAVIR